MEYVLNILEKEKDILIKCLNEWESKEYPLAKQDRDDKLNQINAVINLIKKQKSWKTN